MEEFMMKNLVLLSDTECSVIFGGRNENLANFIEMAARCIGSAARLIYLFMNKGAKNVAMQATEGRYFKF